MPMLDVYIPEGAMRGEAEHALLGRLTEILLRWEAFDPADSAIRSVSWAFLHRPVDVYVAGAPAALPRYKVVASVPEGHWGGNGRITPLAAILERQTDDAERARALAAERIAASRAARTRV